VTAGALAFPVLAASPTPSASPKPNDHANGNGKAHAAKPDKSHAPETPVTLHGRVTKSTDADGHDAYTLSAGGATYKLSVGPPWFWGDRNPLDAYVGKDVTVDGDREGTDGDVDVNTVDGKVIREPGKPPWAGGPKVVGPAHPGYKAWKAARDHEKADASTAP
jgi:hypothetical protein